MEEFVFKEDSDAEGNLLGHQQSIISERLFKCTDCPFAAHTKANLRHHRLIHCINKQNFKDDVKQPRTSERGFKCYKCAYATTRKSTLLRHQRVHAVKMLYTCPDCDFSTPYKDCLFDHEKSHTGEKPYKCSHCEYATAQKLYFTIHQRSHQRKTYSKHCKDASTNLIDHPINHTERPVKCNGGDFDGTEMMTLRSHTQENHSGSEIKYSCLHCDFATPDKYSLLVHERSHTGQKLYECPNCEYATSQESYFSIHQRTHTL